MRLYRPSTAIRMFYPGAVFRVRTRQKELYLTFDDGPDPESTPYILKILEAHNIKAVFFCCGKMAEKHPELIELIRSSGHLVGNHGYVHYDGWKTAAKDYLDDVSLASGFTSGIIFRPPYGRITLSQFRILAKTYTVVFWDLMPHDYDNRMTSVKILTILRRKVRNGSVIVLHDRRGSSVLTFLDDFIREAGGMGYAFLKLPVSGKE